MLWIIVELIVFILAATFAIAFYYEKPDDLQRLSLLVSVILLGIAVVRRSVENAREKNKYIFASQLAKFVDEGNELRSRKNEEPLPIEEYNSWVSNIESYLKDNKKEHYVTRLNDFSGLVFYGNGSEKSKFENTLDGRLRRLHEFIKETGV